MRERRGEKKRKTGKKLEKKGAEPWTKRGETQKQENEDAGNTYKGAENQQEKTQNNSRRTGGGTKKRRGTERESEKKKPGDREGHKETRGIFKIFPRTP